MDSAETRLEHGITDKQFETSEQIHHEARVLVANSRSSVNRRMEYFGDPTRIIRRDQQLKGQ